MSKQPQKRRFSLEDKFMKSKSINDLIYGKLQKISYISQDGRRFVYNKDFKQADMAKELGDMKLRSFKRHFQALQTAELVQKGTVKDLNGKEVVCYYLPENKNEKFMLIPITTLDFLITVSRVNVIKIYLYLLDKYEWKHRSKDTYVFTKKELIQAIGLNPNYSPAYTEINYILTCLKNNDLIDYEEFYYNGNVPNIRLVNVSTVVRGLEEKTKKDMDKEREILNKIIKGE